MKSSQPLPIILALVSLSIPACRTREDPAELEEHKIVLTTPKAMDIIVTEQYVCQIHSKRHIKVRALQAGYLEAIPVKEGQEVKKDQVMFKVIPILYKTKLDADVAEAKLAELELNNTKRLREQGVVSIQEVALYDAKLAKANAKVEQAKAELNFTEVKATFDGIIDRQEEQHGSLVKEGDVLTTLSDNSTMWVYFNVPERQYHKYTATPDKEKEGWKIELVLANGSKFKKKTGEIVTGKIAAIGTKFNNESGNVSFRADFENPDQLLRYGMTGNILIHKTQKNALVIPQRATFEILDKQYVYVVGKDDVVHQREIKVRSELEDVFVIDSGLAVDDRFVYEGIRQVRDGKNLDELELRPAEEILAHLKYHAE